LLVLGSIPVVHAVTLGPARVTSYLNQPLEAEIELVGLEPGQHEDLRIRIANQAQFDRLGIAYTNFLADLRFDVVQSSGRWIVRVRSSRPVSEPFLDFPVQMTWPGGQMVRQYTLLLDPLTLSRPATVSRATAPAPAPRARPQPAPAGSRIGATYGPVQRGETLWPIAQRVRPSGVTTKQMAMALLRANPQAFIDNNINKLRAGAVLTIPPLGEIQQMDAAAANRAFAEQTRQWQAPVATSPREVAVAPAPPSAPPAQVDPVTARPTDEPSEPSPDAAAAASDSDDQLRIVAKEESSPQSDDDAIKQQLLVTMEEIESNRITTSEIESRVATLEQELSKMQALVELKDRQIAALQSEIDARETTEQAASTVESSLPPATGETAAAPAPQAAEPAAPPVTTEAPVRVEAEAVPATEPSPRPWYEQYQWLIWAVLGAIGLVAVGMMIRRQTAAQAHSNVPMADLPSTPPPSYTPARQPAREDIRQAERDFDALTKEPAQASTPIEPAAAPLPEIDESQAKAVESRMQGITNSMLDELLDEGKELDKRPPVSPPEFDDKEIATWVEELGSEIEQLELPDTEDTTATVEPTKRKPSAADEIDDDIPSLLNELDGQLSSADATVSPPASGIDLEPIDEPLQLDALDDADKPAADQAVEEDDTFTMSLDLARAYLEIGDNDGARDMLKQALSGARTSDHRQQIEELLKQIG
jgi:FimV-like protein